MTSRVDPRALQGQPSRSGRLRSNRLAGPKGADGQPQRVSPHLEARARVRREFRKGIVRTAELIALSSKRSVRTVPDTAPMTLVVSVGPEPWAGAEADLLGAAREISPDSAITLLTFGAPNCQPGQAGADRLITLQQAVAEEGHLRALLAVEEHFRPVHLIFAEAGDSGDLARRLAARTRRSIAVNVTSIKPGDVVFAMDGGRREATRPAPYIMCLRRSACAAYEGEDTFEAKPLAPPDFAQQEQTFRDNGLVPVRATELPLNEADLVLSAGAGITDWESFFRVAEGLSAAVGGSRVVCDAGSLPRSRQVGASGQLIEARCYVAMGISGAPQHLQGIQACRHVVAVNTDSHAPIMKRADLAIVADAQEVLRALRDILGEERQP
jgi:electron transfer flavoprotein alpha subunit